MKWHREGELSSLGVVPDAAFGLALPGQAPVLYCVEVDRATMPVKRTSAHLSSVQRKLLAYHASWQQRILIERFGWKRFRVLTLTTSPDRVGNLREAARELPGGHGLFLFAHFEQLAGLADALALPWQGVGDEPLTRLSDS